MESESINVFGKLDKEFEVLNPSLENALSEDMICPEGGNDHILVKIDDTLVSGMCRVETVGGRKIIYLSSADKGHISPGLLRLVDRADVQGECSLNRPNFELRKRDVVLDVTTMKTSRGFNIPDQLDVEVNTDSRLIMNGKKIESLNDLHMELADNSKNNMGTSLKQIILKDVPEDMAQAFIDGTGTESEEFKNVTKVQTSKLEAFKKMLLEFIKNPREGWNQFKFKRKVKDLGIGREDDEYRIEI